MQSTPFTKLHLILPKIKLCSWLLCILKGIPLLLYAPLPLQGAKVEVGKTQLQMSHGRYPGMIYTWRQRCCRGGDSFWQKPTQLISFNLEGQVMDDILPFIGSEYIIYSVDPQEGYIMLPEMTKKIGVPKNPWEKLQRYIFWCILMSWIQICR